MIMEQITKNLYLAFDELNKLKFNGELPEVAITIQSKPRTKKEQILGWCSVDPIWEQEKSNGTKVYKYEINLVAEALNRPYEEIMCTFIHELCHLSNIDKHIEDCSKRGKHNENFKKEAERVGLIVEQGNRIGWAITTLSDTLKEEVNNLQIDKSVFNTYRIVKEKEKRERKVAPTYKYKCPNCGKEFKSKLEDMSVECKDCEVDFECIGSNKKEETTDK